MFDEDFRSGSDIDGYASPKDDSAEQEDSEQEENDPSGEDNLGRLEDKPEHAVSSGTESRDSPIREHDRQDRCSQHQEAVNVGRRSYIHRPQFKANVGQESSRVQVEANKKLKAGFYGRVGVRRADL
ncbi:hypothetical protein HYDPIDRAFT_118563 [Hydnomerulius pinastri MD-312]|uniref:Uncharacterized protein n=1 Tax=Hydnomerulius pinastri MD-312 TaxID=994086 RepID=A0A0C9W8I6_9AGAM|nr:hypothetical protein HYDPIDRAFT_118563 [Hydnomerulius pinastri MD-312]